ncbi:MAG: hypothetical protein R3B96_03390 [Pirellulaceae bacterium]
MLIGMFGIGVTELLILLVGGLVCVGVTAVIVALVVWALRSIRNKP